MTRLVNASSADRDRRIGPSRLSTWSSRRIRFLWLLWPAIVVVLCAITALVSVRVHGDFTEVRVDLTRSNLIGLAMVLVVPPACLTLLWWRMRGRRHGSSSARGR